jgi:NAD-reducing hydrogenase small subunit
MRNPFTTDAVMARAYTENAQHRAGTMPEREIPALLDRVQPVHEVVKVDVFVPGCPPHADLIFTVLSELLEGKIPDHSTDARFG